MGKKKGKSDASGNPPIPPDPRLYAIGKDVVAEAHKQFRGQWTTQNGATARAGLPTAAGHRFVGECTPEGRRHGHGLEVFPRGGRYTVYEGEFKAGKSDGTGTMTTRDGAVLCGEWRNGRLHGRAVCTFPNGVRYEGDYEEGKRSGNGISTYANGSQYEGHWLNGLRHGHGTLRTADGAVYTGDFAFNRMHGQGRMVYPSGVIRVGVWQDGRRIEGGAPAAAAAAEKTAFGG